MNKELAADIAKAKKKLVADARRLGYIRENFGGKECRAIGDKWNTRQYEDENWKGLLDFQEWCAHFDLAQLKGE